MSDQESEREAPREDAPNPTQEAIDRDGPTDEPVDVGGWEAGGDAEPGDPS